jgi:hypothetical protein
VVLFIHEKMARPYYNQNSKRLRTKFASKEKLSNYYKELGTLMTNHGLHDKPESNFNIDEIALQTEHTPSKMCHDKNVKPQCEPPIDQSILQS